MGFRETEGGEKVWQRKEKKQRRNWRSLNEHYIERLKNTISKEHNSVN